MPPDLTDADRWQAWARAYVSLCQRVIDEATATPGASAASSASTLSGYLDLLRKHSELEPNRYSGLIITPRGAICPECNAPNGGGYVTLNCPACRDADGSMMPWQTPGWS